MKQLKDIKKGFSPVFRAGIILFATALPLLMPMYAVEALSAPSGGMSFDIPTTELSRAKKVPAASGTSFDVPASELKSAAAKPAAVKPKKKKKSVAKDHGLETAAAAPTQAADQAKSKGSATAGATSLATPQKSTLWAGPAQPFRTFNVPYSFVVTGKSTVIKAVIYREADDLRAVNCMLRLPESAAPTVVKMAKVDGSRFTYSAILPEVPVGASSIRYTIVAVDSSDTQAVSQEFLTPVRFSPLVPGWQF